MQNVYVGKKSRFLIIILAILLLLSNINLNIFKSSATSQRYPFDKTNVLNDLQSSSGFNIYNYPYSLNESERIINFVEFAYSPYVRDNFALYIYLYNPKNIKWSIETESNSVEMAVEYALENNEVKPTVYDNFNLVFCNKSERAGYEGLFYKFRVLDHESADGLTIQDRVDNLERRYDISSVTLTKEDGSIEKLLIGGCYCFTGYAKGYGYNINSASTLKNVAFNSFETFEVKANMTKYETAIDAGSDYHYYDIDSLYFSVPDKYFTNYGSLQKIKLEWYEYKTTPIFIINEQEMYDSMDDYVGVNIVGQNYGGTYKAFAAQNKYKIFFDRESEIINGETYYTYGLCYNMIHSALNLGWKGDGTSIYDMYKGVVKEAIPELQWLFNYDASISNLKSYSKKYSVANSGYVPIKNAQISADLFLDKVDYGRTKGYNVVEFDAGYNFDLKSEEDALSLLQKWEDCGLLKGKNSNIKIEDIAPIVCGLTASDAYNQNSYIGKNERSTFTKFANNAQSNNERVVALRIAVTERWDEGFYTYTSDRTNITNKGENGKAKQQTLFFDADTVQLTFQTNDEYLDVVYANDPSSIDTDADFEDRGSWFNDFVYGIGAFGVLIVGIVGLFILAFIIIKVIGSFMPGGTFARIIMLIIVVALGFAGFSLLNWMLATIESLGGLML